MLFPFTRIWTRRQKALIIGSAVLALALSAVLIYGYERHYRGPGQEMLYGTWQFDGFFYVEFHDDHTFSMIDLDEPHSLIAKGTWYAGGKFLYMGFPLTFRHMGNTLDIWRIDDISAEQITVRYCKDCMDHVFQRVDPAATRASNQAIERTADRSSSRF